MPDIMQVLTRFAADSPVQFLTNLPVEPFTAPDTPTSLFLKRDDLLHPQVSGNKWRKLKYNLLAAREQGYATLLTFGGAYSNHLYATAAAGTAFGFRTIGVVRGDELANAPRNSTLTFCELQGMQLNFVSRTDYRRKDDPDFLADLIRQVGPCYILPEGGTNDLAIRGTAEIMPELIAQLGYIPDYVCCPVGTGGTLAGLLASVPVETTVLGFAVLKGFDGLPNVNGNYHFGGYARATPELLRFIETFEHETGVLIEPIYTGKMLFGLYDLARQGYFRNGSTVVAVHTGGLQGRTR